MRTKVIAILALAAAVISCKKNPSVTAFFTTDKDVYEIQEDVVVENLSTSKNVEIGLCKWEWDNQTSYQDDLGVISFSEVGEYTIRLTVYPEQGEGSPDTYEKVVNVYNHNEPPVAAFDAPSSAVQDAPVQFTDRSSDNTGRIVSWLWDIGGIISTEQNPSVSFISWGDLLVTLTVTDNYGASSSVSRTVTVEQSEGHEMQVVWSRAYDTSGHAYWTAPAITPDGSRIYVSSTGYHLVCFDESGNEIGRYDIGEKGANPYSYNNPSSPSISNQSPTPSLDVEGNVFIPVQFYEKPQSTTTGEGGLFSIKPDCAGLNWYFSTGEKSSYRFVAPVVFSSYVAVCLKENDSAKINQNFGVFNRTTGALVQALNCDQGSYGGIAVSQNSTLVYDASRSDAGYKIATGGYGNWSPSANSDAGRLTNLLNGKGDTKGYQPAISADNLVYVCVSASSSTQMVCACYDLDAYVPGAPPKALWMTTVEAYTPQCGYGAVLDEAGNAYFMAGDKVFRLNKADGSVAWTFELESCCIGVAAIDSKGYLYVCDVPGNRLLKLSSASGQLVSEVSVSNPKGCPTIAPDGSVYVNGNSEGKPTLYKIVGTGENKSTAPGSNWSQVGANPQKNGCAPGAVFD